MLPLLAPGTLPRTRNPPVFGGYLPSLSAVIVTFAIPRRAKTVALEPAFVSVIALLKIAPRESCTVSCTRSPSCAALSKAKTFRIPAIFKPLPPGNCPDVGFLGGSGGDFYSL